MATGKRNPANKLEPWEVALIKAMAASGKYADQEIQAYFTRPSRTINHARILAIREGRRHANITVASVEDLEEFLENWPQVDWETGAHLSGDELILKAREAMIQAVQGYNNPKSYFKTEIFIVNSIIAPTYLLHYYFRKEEIECVYEKDGAPITTKYGAPRRWALETCLEHPKCFLDNAVKANLNFLIVVRHEIEHQMTNRIDASFASRLQACALNFNSALKYVAGPRFGLERELAFSLQFATITRDQRNTLLKEKDLPAHLLAMKHDYESKLAAQMMNDPRYAYRVAFIEVAANRAGGAEEAIRFIRADTAEGEAVHRVLMKETEKPKYKPAQIIKMMNNEGFHHFNSHQHTLLWKKLKARKPNKKFGVYLKPNDWWWYENWVHAVRQHCVETYLLPAEDQPEPSADGDLPPPAPPAHD
ncbi:DUF3644 domain-containing protein [Methylobacterium nigriterrae]|uniref:DUF3644 domain-containing protein n=1 Tax=Methylobacterium nigriterrae TaxID=3127512 RepID=UPI0030135849